MDKSLNIITLNIPYPPDYGGIIDTFYRIKALHSEGVAIYLHCFTYGREKSPELELLCRSVKYYKRFSGFLYHLSALPYIVSTRKSDELLKNLCENEYPILFDGIHTTGILAHPSLSGRKKIVRMHNIEHDYYRTLAKNETGILRKFFFLSESEKLKRYERILSVADHILTVSPSDNDHFGKLYGKSILMPSSHPFGKTEIIEGSGNYIIYHGDLSVNENSAIAGFLISEVFPHIGCNAVVAGKNPPVWLIKRAGKYPNVRLFADPDTVEMGKFIREAHINILPVTKMNGLKLKLLYALYAGRHLIVNSEMAKGLDPGNQYHIADSPIEMISLISKLMKQPFSEEMINERNRFLAVHFNNSDNVNKLISLI